MKYLNCRTESFSELQLSYRSMATEVLATCDGDEQLLKLHWRPTDATCVDVKSADSVKRCLFGVVDHQATRADLAALRHQLDAQSRQRWNFDFRSGTPLMTSLPLSTCGGGGARWAWSRVDESRDQSRDTRPEVLGDRRRATHAASPSPRRPSDTDRSTAAATKRRRMSLNPSLEVKAKVAGSELKVVTSRRKSVGGLERRRSLRSTSLLGSPSRMSVAFFFTRCTRRDVTE